MDWKSIERSYKKSARKLRRKKILLKLPRKSKTQKPHFQQIRRGILVAILSSNVSLSEEKDEGWINSDFDSGYAAFD